MQTFDPKKYPNLVKLDGKVSIMLSSGRAKEWSTERVEYEICRIHPIYWMEQYGYIKPGMTEAGADIKSTAEIPFKLNTPQLIIADKICESLVEDTYTRIQVTILKHRKAGISTLIAAFDYWFMRFYKMDAFLIADINAHTDTLIEMLKTFQKKDTCGAGDPNTDHWPPLTRPMPRSKKGMRLSNGSMCEQDSGDTDNPGTSGTVTVLHMSENAKWRNPYDSETSLLNSVPRSGFAFVVKESTAFGSNKFAQDCEDAESGLSSWSFIFISWLDMSDCEDSVNPGDTIGLSREEKELMDVYKPKMRLGHILYRRRQIGLLQSSGKFKQDFPLNSREPFQVSGSNFFDVVAVQERINRIEFYKDWKTNGMTNISVRHPEVYSWVKHNSGGERTALSLLERDCVIPCHVEINEQIDGSVSWVRNKEMTTEAGAAILFRVPVIGRKYILSVDVAEGKKSVKYESDDSVIEVFDARTHEQAMEWGGVFDEEITASYAIRIAKIYNNAIIVPEMNNKCGGLLWGFLQSSGYRNFYYRNSVIGNKTRREPGWETRVGMKKDVCGQFRISFKNGDCLIHSLDLLDEMLYFIDNQGKLGSAEGHKDDRVMCTCIAVKVMSVTPMLQNDTKSANLPTDMYGFGGSLVESHVDLGRYV